MRWLCFILPFYHEKYEDQKGQVVYPIWHSSVSYSARTRLHNDTDFWSFCFVLFFFTMSCSRRKELSICCCVNSLKQAVPPSYTHRHLGKMMSSAVSHLGIPDIWMLRGLVAGVFHFLRMLRELLKYPPVTRYCAILPSSSFQTFSSRQMI